MLIDRTHRSWILLTSFLFVIATVLYYWYATTWPEGPAGRSWPGMLFGVIGTALMMFAGLLSVRKKTVRCRLGSLSWWLKGHIWLGLLSLPIIFYHTAFRWGGALEQLLMVIFLLVIVSGIVGLLLQNVLPRVMKRQLPVEFIPDQLGNVCTILQTEADEEIIACCGRDAMRASLSESDPNASPLSSDPSKWLASLYLSAIRPYLAIKTDSKSILASIQQAEMVFERARTTLPDKYYATLGQLEEKCNTRRQLALETRLYGLLHGWLKLHIPLSIMLLVFTVLHVVTALYY